MFTWICPQCGREVPPAYTECPDCEAKAKSAAAEAAPQPPAPQPVEPEPAATAAFGTMPPPPPPLPVSAAPVPVAAPVAAPTPPPPAPAPAPIYLPPAPPRRSGMPGWLLTIVFAFAFVGLAASVYWGSIYLRGSAGAGGAAPVTENPAAKGGGKPHPLAKYLEIAGMRFIGDKKNTQARFVLINHSEAEITGLAANVTVWGRTQRSEEDAVGTLQFKVDDIGPTEFKEVTVTLNTKLKIYELPDWQNVTTDLQITAPPAP
jgi:hypothetical protein